MVPTLSLRWGERRDRRAVRGKGRPRAEPHPNNEKQHRRSPRLPTDRPCAFLADNPTRPQTVEGESNARRGTQERTGFPGGRGRLYFRNSFFGKPDRRIIDSSVPMAAFLPLKPELVALDDLNKLSKCVLQAGARNKLNRVRNAVTASSTSRKRRPEHSQRPRQTNQKRRTSVQRKRPFYRDRSVQRSRPYRLRIPCTKEA